MKKILWLAFPFIIGACSSSHPLLKKNDIEGRAITSELIFTDSFTHSKELDSFVNENNIFSQLIFSDSIQEIVQEATTVHLYLMKQTVVLADSDSQVIHVDSVANYPYLRMDSIVSKARQEIIKFILLDNKLYYKDCSLVKQPYSPYLTVEFISNKGKVAFLFSFGTEEIEIVLEQGKANRYRVISWHQIARWCELCLPNDEYVKNFK